MFSPKSLGIITISILFSACSVTKSLYKDKQVSRYNPNASTVDKDYSNPEESEQEEEAMRSEPSRTKLLQAEEAACEGTPMLYEPLPKYEFGNNESESDKYINIFIEKHISVFGCLRRKLYFCTRKTKKGVL